MPRTRSVAWSELKLGIVGVTAMALVATMVVAVGGQGGFFWQRYSLRTHFADAQGLKAGAVVRLNGKDVGTVTSVEFVDAIVEVTMAVNEDVRHLITTESLAAIGSISLLGESSVDLRMAPAGRPLEEGELVPTDPAAAGFGALTTSASESLEQAGELISDLRAGRGTLGRLFTDDSLHRQIEALLQSATAVTRQLREGDGTIAGLMNEPAAFQALKTSLTNLESITAGIRRGDGALGRLLTDDALGESLAATSANLRETTARLNGREGTAGRLINDPALYDRVTSMASRVEGLVAAIDRGEGTAGRLMRDQQLYENMNGAVTELRDLLAEIRKDPKKFLRVSVSIF